MTEHRLTVPANRVVVEFEERALVTIESMQRVLIRAHRVLQNLPSGGTLSAADRDRLMLLVEETLDLSSATMATAVKTLDLADRIGPKSRDNARKILAEVDRLIHEAHPEEEPTDD